MQVARKEKVISKSSKPNEEQTGISTNINNRQSSGGLGIHHQAANYERRRETTQLRRSARLTSKYKYTVPTDKPIVPNRQLLEREGSQRSFDTYEPVHPNELSKQSNFGVPEGSGPHGNKNLAREYSFVLVDCGTHFEMVSPKTVNHFTRVSRCFATMAPYHNFGPVIGEEELRKKLCAKIVDEEPKATAQEAATASTSQTRKRRRSEEEGDEGGAANDVKRPIKKAKVTNPRSKKT